MKRIIKILIFLLVGLIVVPKANAYECSFPQRIWIWLDVVYSQCPCAPAAANTSCIMSCGNEQ